MTQDAEVLSSTSRLLHGELIQGLLSRIRMRSDTLLAFLKADALSLRALVRREVESPRFALKIQMSPYPQGSWRGLQPSEQHHFNTGHDAQPSGLAAKSIADVPHPEHLWSSFWKLWEFTHSAALVCLSKSDNVAELHSRLAFMCLSHYDAKSIQPLHDFL